MSGRGGGGPGGSAGKGGSAGQGGAAGGGGETCSKAEPAPVSDDWCARMVVGAAPFGDRLLALSEAHGLARFFSPAVTPKDADAALVAAFEASADGVPSLGAYAAALPGIVCEPAGGASGRELGAFEATLREGVAWVKPGYGEAKLPEGAGAVVLDLRGLPDLPELDELLPRAAGLALAEPLSMPRYRVRRHEGMTDEAFSLFNTYIATLLVVESEPIAPRGEQALPIVVLTEASMPPKAVEVALALRSSGRASIFGEDLAVAAAEARWAGVGDSGLGVRWRELIDGEGVLLGNTLAADRRAEDPACLVTSAADVPAAPGEAQFGEASRPPLMIQDSFGATASEDPTSSNAARAALVSAHAATRLFSPRASAELDERLAETLGAIEGSSLARPQVRRLLRRLGTALDDGHQFVGGSVEPVAGYFLVALERLESGGPVVRRSHVEGINPGDVLTSVAGQPMSAWLADALSITSAATEGYRFNIAVRGLLSLPGPTEFGVRSPDGAERLVNVTPADATALDAFQYWAPAVRPAGPLDDLGAPDLYYINLDGSTLFSLEEFELYLDDASLSGAQGLVLDLRGYPEFNHYVAAQELIQHLFFSPRFRVPVLEGPGRRAQTDDSFQLPPIASPSFAGPIALLVGNSTVSAAENFSSMLVGAGRVTVVGQQTAATNGNITGLALPAGFSFTFTGMDVGFPDGQPYNGVGIAPDVPVAIAPGPFAAGHDPELEAAIGVLNAAD